MHKSESNRAVILYKPRETPYDVMQGSGLDIDSPLWNVMNWSSGLSGHPRAYFQVCGLDTARDDVLVFERALRREHGVMTRVDMYSGLPHIFWMLYPAHPKSSQYLQDTLRGIGWLLNRNAELSKI